MIFYIFNTSYKLIATTDKINQAIHAEEINNENALLLTVTEPDYMDLLVEHNLVGFFDDEEEFQLFRIQKVEDEDNGIVTRDLYAVHIAYDLAYEYVEDKRPTGTAETILTALLTDSDWEVGTVADFGSSHVQFYYESIKSGIAKIIEAMGGEVRYRLTLSGSGITHKYIDILESRGSVTGKRFAYTKDIINIHRTIDMDNVITRCYGFGKGEAIVSETGEISYGRRTNFNDIVWTTGGGDPVDKPADQKYVEDAGAIALYGTRTGKAIFDDETDAEAVLELTWNYLQTNKEPIVSYELDVMLLEKLSGYSHEAVRLGDTVVVIDKAVTPEIKASARVLRFEKDLLALDQSKIVLGNFVETLTGQVRDNIKVIDRYRDREGAYDDGTSRAQEGLDKSGYINLPIHSQKIVGDGALEGLNLNSKYLGYFNESQNAWRAFIDDKGNFLFQKDASNYFSYDGTSFTFRGPIVADDISSGSLIVGGTDRLGDITIYDNLDNLIARIDESGIWTKGVIRATGYTNTLEDSNWIVSSYFGLDTYNLNFLRDDYIVDFLDATWITPDGTADGTVKWLVGTDDVRKLNINNSLYFRGIFNDAANRDPESGSLAVGKDFYPIADGYILGAINKRWEEIYGENINASGKIVSTLVNGYAPFTIASQTLNTNLNADFLDGYHANAFLLLSGGTMTGQITAASSGFNLNNISASAAAATHYYVQTGSGNLVPKTLANTRAEIVTKAIIESVLTGNIDSHTHDYLPNNAANISSSAAITALKPYSYVNAINTDGSSGFPSTYGSTYLFTSSNYERDLILYKQSASWNLYLLKMNSSRTGFDTGSALFWNNRNHGANSGLNADLLDGLHATAFPRLMGTASITWTPSILGTGASDYKSITVSGASPGDYVIISCDLTYSYPLSIRAYVTGTNSVRIIVTNIGQSSPTYPSSTWKVMVLR